MNFLFIKKSWKKLLGFPQIDKKHKICILELFLHLTLKTGFSFAIIEINYILKYIKIENSYLKL